MLIFQHERTCSCRTAARRTRYIPKQYRFDTFTSARLEEFVVAWNKNLVPNPPTSFQDLADPKWKGKLALEPTDTDWFATLENYFMTDAKPKLTQAQADDMFKKIAANSQLIPGHSAEASALAAGQVSIIVSGHGQSIEQLQAKNAPITFGPPFVTPVIERRRAWASRTSLHTRQGRCSSTTSCSARPGRRCFSRTASCRRTRTSRTTRSRPIRSR